MLLNKILAYPCGWTPVSVHTHTDRHRHTHRHAHTQTHTHRHTHTHTHRHTELNFWMSNVDTVTLVDSFGLVSDL